MTTFRGVKKTLTFEQTNSGNINRVFPLLCPVREKDWLDGWEYRMIYSLSGLIEKDCVFSTPNENGPDTIWQVTRYSTETFTIEFVRLTPGENIVRINIQLEPIDQETTRTHIVYQYTGLNERQNAFIEQELEQQFLTSMSWWERSINHYLTTGTCLRRKAA